MKTEGGFFYTAFLYCVTEVRTHSVSWPYVALLAASECFCADSELISRKQKNRLLKLCLSRETAHEILLRSVVACGLKRDKHTLNNLSCINRCQIIDVLPLIMRKDKKGTL